MAHEPSFLLTYLHFLLTSLPTIIFSYMIIKFIRSHFTENSKKCSTQLPPGPKPWPIVGSIPEMLANKPASKWIHNLMEEMNTEIACIRLGKIHVIPVTCPAIAREFLKKHDAAFQSRPENMATDIVTGGFLTIALTPFGEQWKKMKRVMVNSLLSPLKHQWLLGKRNEEADNLVFYIYNKCCKDENSGGVVNVRTAATHYCANVFRKLVFNTRYFGKVMEDGGPGFEEEEHVHAAFVLLKYIYAFSLSDYFPWLGRFDLDGHKRKLENSMRVIEKYHDPIIQERMNQWNDGERTVEEDLLDVMISLKDGDNPLLTFKEIKAQIRELMIEMVDNPSNAVEWALAEIINQPELLERATRELDSVVGKDRLVQESDIHNLNFVKACARESFRLHPIVPFNVPHVATNDTKVGNYLIPKGSHVLLGRSGLGRNPKVWSDPLKFNPDRHLKSDGSDVVLVEPDLKFISFSTGRRSCPGVTLGTTMTIMPLARLLHGFSWSVPPNVSGIDLAESNDDMFLAKPLEAVAKPRLAAKVYHI